MNPIIWATHDSQSLSWGRVGALGDECTEQVKKEDTKLGQDRAGQVSFRYLHCQKMALIIGVFRRMTQTSLL